jgi:Tol biopolymer transport system component/DNA-binding winged helix-turn-helix (wHTH) protein
MNIMEFGPFQLDQKRRQLLHNGKEIYLQPKTLKLLFLLVEKHGCTVTKDEIMNLIWEGRIIEENNLAQRIFHLRRALGEYEEMKQAIVTVPGVGYRFDLPVRIVSSADDQTSPVANETPIPPIETVAARESGILTRFRSSPGRWILLILVIIMGGVWLGRSVRMGKFLPLNKANSTAPIVTTFAALPGSESFPSFSPDGKFIAFTWDNDTKQNHDIYVKMVNQGEFIRVTSNPAYEQQATWSPDGLNIAFLRAPNLAGDRYHLMVTPALGGTEREVARVWGGLDWSPDGKWFAVSDKEPQDVSTGIYLIAADGSSRRKLSLPKDEDRVYDTFPTFSNDGRELAFVRWKSDASGELFIINITDGRLRQLTFDDTNIQSPHWSYDGKEILFTSSRSGNRRLWRIPVTGGPAQLVENFPNDIEHITISPASPVIAFTQNIFERAIDLYSPRKDGPPPCEINSSRPEDGPRISNDGKFVVFESQQSGWNEIWTARTDCSELFQVTKFNEHVGGSPVWSHDGKRIIFGRFIDGQSDIVSINADGTDYRRLTSHPGTDVLPSASHDGKWIYFSSDRDGRYEVYRLPTDGGKDFQITRNGGNNGFESFDGQSLIYTRNEILYRKNLSNGPNGEEGEEGPIPELAGINVSRYWALTPDAIYYVPQKQKSVAPTYRYDLKTRAITLVNDQRRASLQLLPGISVSPQEDRIAISYLKFVYGDIMLVKGWK